MIKIAICDDNNENVRELSELLKVFAERRGVEIVIVSYSSGKNLLFSWDDAAKQSDILYLDINMPEMDGVTAAKRLRDKGYRNEIIFFTSSETKWVQAFDVNAFHYIIKDETSTKKAEEIFQNAVTRIQKKEKEYISLNCAGENHNIMINSISHFVVFRRILTVYFDQDKSLEFYSTLGKMEEILFEKGFIRINKMTLINVIHIKSHTAQEIRMRGGEIFTIGRSYRQQVKEEIAYWNGEVGM